MKVKSKNQIKFEKAIADQNFTEMKSIFDRMLDPKKTLEKWAEKGEHAIVLAVRNDNLPVVRWLIEKVPSCSTAKASDGRNIYATAYMNRTQSSIPKVLTWMNPLKLRSTLEKKENGFDVNAYKSDGSFCDVHVFFQEKPKQSCLASVKKFFCCGI